MKISAALILCLLCSFAYAQDRDGNFKIKKLAVRSAVITIDSVSINPSQFSLKTTTNQTIDTSLYKVDFSKALLTFKTSLDLDTIVVSYLSYPDFLTKSYYQLDPSIIVNQTQSQQKLYQMSQSTVQNAFTPFDGLMTSGSISRGVTIGNNQNSVLNSELDLQISGKLSDKVSLRASIQDANVPLQESGYSQRLDEFDQVFIELYSDQWNIRAGDIDLENTQSYFGRFSKRVQGLLGQVDLEHSESKTNIFAAGALVRGQFTSSQFQAQEGNQGPYKLRGPNNELYVLVVSGSETVYVNGVPIKRGENEDYIIDYNAGEIIFNATFPMTSDMRVTVDYQYSERNFSRFTVYGGGGYETEKLKINMSIYSETDAKNQPLQQNLSADQVQILANAGDDKTLMTAPSEVLEAYNENRILYKKELVDGIEVYVFSNNPEDELYSVKFSNVGLNQGDYRIFNANAVSTIYEYVAPIQGIAQGSYAPIVQLIAPTQLQMAILNATYAPTDRTEIFMEVAGSKNNLNLFSNLDDDDNDGFAGKFKIKHGLIKNDSLWNLSALLDTDIVHKNFKSVERMYNVEFNRDWNLENPMGNQHLLSAGLELSHFQKGMAYYKFEYLDYSQSFNGIKHNAFVDLRLNRWRLFSNSSILNSKSELYKSTFLRTFNRATYGFDQQWVGGKLAAESNEQNENSTQELSALSQRFKSYEVFYGIGDSTKVFAEVGYKYRVNDSLRLNRLENVSRSNTYYVKSRILQTEHTNLGVYINYRQLKMTDVNLENEKSLNSRIYYNQQLFNQMLLANTVFETNSGTLPQQDFTYVQVEPGQGAYTWIDYNGNGIQELDEFEVAQFQDEGSYVRVLLPNQIYLKTHQNRLSQNLTINPSRWAVNENAMKRFWSQFYNQTSFLVDRKVKREGSGFDLNPFSSTSDDPLSLNRSLRNILFFNRGKQHFTSSYTFLNSIGTTLLSTGSQTQKQRSHQLHFNHKIKETWLTDLQINVQESESLNENYVSRNYTIEDVRFQPKISYLFNDNMRFDIYYQYSNKQNQQGDNEQLLQNKYGFSFNMSNAQKIGFTGELNYFDNSFSGLNNTPVSYQMLEGLQPGKNLTWTLLMQKKLTAFLDLNLNYFGRKTETSKAIHTGTVVLKAYF